MSINKSNSERNAFNIVGAAIAWFAVIGQLVLILDNRQHDVFETLIRFFSYFTILTNVLVALYFTSQIFNLKLLRFLKSKSALTALTVFILIVGLVYQFVLRSVWQPTGFQLVIDELLHSIIPLYVLLYWFFYMKSQDIRPRNLLVWLLYPFFYFLFVMIRGHFSDFYPYPFIDVSSIGYLKVFINFMTLSVFAVMLMGILYVFTRTVKKQKL